MLTLTIPVLKCGQKKYLLCGVVLELARYIYSFF